MEYLQSCKLPVESVPTFLAFAFGPLVLGFTNSILSFEAVENWYPLLRQPYYHVPKSVFGPAWTVLYLCMGFASYAVYTDPKADEALKQSAMFYYAVQLLVNQAFTPLLFTLKRLDLAFLDLLAMFATATATAFLFAQINPIAGLLLTPYLAFMLVAMLLIKSLQRLNPTPASAPRMARKAAIDVLLGARGKIMEDAFGKFAGEHPELFDAANPEAPMGTARGAATSRRDMGIYFDAVVQELAGRDAMMLGGTSATVRYVFMENLSGVREILVRLGKRACSPDHAAEVVRAMQDGAVAALGGRFMEVEAEVVAHFGVLQGYLLEGRSYIETVAGVPKKPVRMVEDEEHSEAAEEIHFHDE